MPSSSVSSFVVSSWFYFYYSFCRWLLVLLIYTVHMQRRLPRRSCCCCPLSYCVPVFLFSFFFIVLLVLCQMPVSVACLNLLAVGFDFVADTGLENSVIVVCRSAALSVHFISCRISSIINIVSDAAVSSEFMDIILKSSNSCVVSCSAALSIIVRCIPSSM